MVEIPCRDWAAHVGRVHPRVLAPPPGSVVPGPRDVRAGQAGLELAGAAGLHVSLIGPSACVPGDDELLDRWAGDFHLASFPARWAGLGERLALWAGWTGRPGIAGLVVVWPERAVIRPNGPAIPPARVAGPGGGSFPTPSRQAQRADHSMNRTGGTGGTAKSEGLVYHSPGLARYVPTPGCGPRSTFNSVGVGYLARGIIPASDG